MHYSLSAALIVFLTSFWRQDLLQSQGLRIMHNLVDIISRLKVHFSKILCFGPLLMGCMPFSFQLNVLQLREQRRKMQTPLKVYKTVHFMF